MFFITQIGKIQRYEPGEPWKRVERGQIGDKKGQSDSDHHPQDDTRKHALALHHYIKPLEGVPQKFKAMHIARAIMSAPALTFSKETPIEKARKELLKHDFKQAAVVSEEGHILGIVHQRDLQDEGAHKISDVMENEVLFADENTDLDQLADVIFEQKIKWLPIVDKEKKVVGVITRNDVMRVILKVIQLEDYRWKS